MNAYDRIAALYDEDMGRSAPPGDVEFYVAQAQAGGGRVLELGAGTGRIALPIARVGLPIVAADRSRPMLRVLAQKALALPATARARLWVVGMDLAAPAVLGPFATVLCPYSVLTYLPDQAAQLALLRWVRAALPAGGRLVCDLFVPQHALLAEPDGRRIDDYQRTCADGTVLIRSKTIHKDLTRQQNTVRRHYRHLQADGTVLAEFSTEETIRYVFQSEMTAMLGAAGFRIEQALAGFDGSPYSDAASTMTFVAQPE